MAEVVGLRRMALNNDIELLNKKGLLEGRMALVFHACLLADQLDQSAKPQSPVLREYRETLDALGIGAVMIEKGSDDFNDLMNKVRSQPETEELEAPKRLRHHG